MSLVAPTDSSKLVQIAGRGMIIASFLSAGRLWKLLSLRKMNPFHAFDQDALLEALTQYYTKYRLIVENDCDEYEFASTKETLFSILEELNERQGIDMDAGRVLNAFTFERKAD